MNQIGKWRSLESARILQCVFGFENGILGGGETCLEGRSVRVGGVEAKGREGVLWASHLH